MLFVLSREKILSYVVAFSTIVILIGISTIFNLQKTTKTSSNIVKQNCFSNME